MSIVLVGSTSGSVTLQEPAVAGSTVLTLPAVTGNVLTDTSPKAGNVIQVVQQTTVSTATTSSAIAVTTGFSASITPTSSSSKILILLSACMDSNVSNGQPNLTIYRNNTTNLANTGGNQMSLSTTYGASSRLITNNAISYLDSPATTSSTTYTAYFFNTGSAGTMIFNATNANNTNTATITLMEIAA